MTSISTISELLTLSGSQFRVYDLGRKITKLPKEKFSKIEQNQLPYPSPSQGHAYIGVVFWQKHSPQTYMWFIKLPLDEKGLLNLGARNHFIAIIIEALGADLTVTPTSQQEELLKNNPYHFTPAQYKLASLHSMISHDVKQESSQYYRDTMAYVTGKKGWDNWQSIGVQGLADFATRINDKDHTKALVEALPHLPKPVLEPLCSALENHTLPLTLIEGIIAKAQDEDIDSSQFISLIRSLASSCQHPFVQNYIQGYIKEKALSIDLIIVLSGRCWDVFTDEKILLEFLEKIAIHCDEALFLSIFKDLVAIPTIRPLLLLCIRSSDRSNELAHYIGLLFSTNKTKH